MNTEGGCTTGGSWQPIVYPPSKGRVKVNAVGEKVKLKEYGKVELGNYSVINNSSGEMCICGKEISHDTKVGA